METLLYSRVAGRVACYDPAHLFGWLFTAAAVSLGAPFWFDLLSRVAKLRGAGGGRRGVQE